MAHSRHLAAILFTDIVGFTSLSQNDEAEALRLLEAHGEVVRPLLGTYGGREVKSTGDGVLAEFESARDATRYAIEVQQRARERNREPGVTPLQIRIGIHLGDVERRGLDVFGDTVNIASRIVSEAEPGGIWVSSQVHDQVRNKVTLRLEGVGPRTLKGLRSPVEIYRVALPWPTAPVASPMTGPTRLAVLPFANISPDPKDEYLADGLTEETITLLSQLPHVRVIARTSVNQYKSTPKSVSQIGAELGVSSVLEGSVRKVGDQLRITVQLIDVGSQEHTWAGTYDRKLADILELQTDVARRIAEVLRVKVGRTAEPRPAGGLAVRPDSYIAYLRGRALLHDRSEESLNDARKQFELAVKLDPNNAAAYSGIAVTASRLAWGPYERSLAELRSTGRTCAARAIELDPNLAEAHGALAMVLHADDDRVDSEKEFLRSLSLNPSDSVTHRHYAVKLFEEGRIDTGLMELELAEESDPRSAGVVQHRAQVLMWLRRLEEAKARIDHLAELAGPGKDYHWLLAEYYASEGNFPKALEEADVVEGFEPGRGVALRAWTYASMGEKGKATELLARLEKMPARLAPPWSIAGVYAVLGDLDHAFQWLDSAAERHDFMLQFWRCEASLELARRDPRFTELLRRSNIV